MKSADYNPKKWRFPSPGETTVLLALQKEKFARGGELIGVCGLRRETIYVPLRRLLFLGCVEVSHYREDERTGADAPVYRCTDLGTRLAMIASEQVAAVSLP